MHVSQVRKHWRASFLYWLLLFIKLTQKACHSLLSAPYLCVPLRLW